MNFRKPSEKEEEFFVQEELRKRKALMEETMEKMEEEAKSEAKRIHWMRCPKCGMELTEIRFQGVEVDKCTACGGIYLDRGELELLLNEEDASVLQKVLRLFS